MTLQLMHLPMGMKRHVRNWMRRIVRRSFAKFHEPIPAYLFDDHFDFEKYMEVQRMTRGRCVCEPLPETLTAAAEKVK